MVTRWDEYEANIGSFRQGGFNEQVAEYLLADNSGGNLADGYVALNEFLQAARGTYIIICHQDVRLLHEGLAELEDKLEELSALDSAWAVCGNAGIDNNGYYANCISHPHEEKDVVGGPFPVRMASLDENFLVVRREANLAVSRDLSGFHHYGTDLCTIAEMLGWTSYVIAFLLRHDSSGTVDYSFMNSRSSMARKY